MGESDEILRECVYSGLEGGEGERHFLHTDRLIFFMLTGDERKPGLFCLGRKEPCKSCDDCNMLDTGKS